MLSSPGFGDGLELERFGGRTFSSFSSGHGSFPGQQALPVAEYQAPEALAQSCHARRPMPIARAATTALTFTAKLSRELPLRYSRLPLAPFARSPGTTRLEVCTEESTDSGHSLFAQCNSRNAERPFRFSTGSRTARVQVWHAGQAAPLISTVSALISHITALAEFRSLAALIFLEESNLHLRSAHKVQRGVDFVRVAVVLVRANRRRRATASRCHFP